MTSSWVDRGESDLVVTTRVRWFHSLRWRVAASAAVLAALLVGVTGLVLAEVTLAGATDQLRSEAEAQLRAVAAAAAFGGAPPPQAVTTPSAVPGPLRDLVENHDGVATFADGSHMWAATRQNDGILATRVGVDALEAQRRSLATALVALTSSGAVIAGLFSWLIAGRLTARLREAAAGVNTVIRGDTVVDPTLRDEVGVMNRALQATASALTARLQREQEFTADVAHDLRTPLTALVSATDLLPHSAEADRVRRQVRRVRRLVGDLLDFARADAPHNPPPLGSSVSEVVREATELLSDDGLVTVRTVTDRRVDVDPARLGIVVRNVVGNAIQHGAPPVDIEIDRSHIRVTDRGPGFPTAVLESGPRRFGTARTTAGTGLGLAIVTQHCRAMGLLLSLHNPVGGGSVVEIGLPPEPDAV